MDSFNTTRYMLLSQIPHSHPLPFLPPERRFAYTKTFVFYLKTNLSKFTINEYT